MLFRGLLHLLLMLAFQGGYHQRLHEAQWRKHVLTLMGELGLGSEQPGSTGCTFKPQTFYYLL